ncbi:MAG TPA: DUF2806 domain-containing protein [Thermoanaerobaculia bacterium]
MSSESPPLVNLNLTEPLSKLIETVGNGIGILYEPRRILKKAKAEAEALKISTEGKLQVQEIEARTQARLHYIELRRQKNIEEIVRQAADQMPKDVSGQPVDQDWVADFFGHCQDVGNGTLQSLWARLLAGEVTNPGSFSRRTLHTVRMMSKEDANLFTKLAGFVWRAPERPVHIVTSKSGALLEKAGFYSQDFLHLRSIGLLEGAEITGVPIRVGEQTWSYCGTHIRIVATEPGGWRGMLLSQVGVELLTISGAVGCPEYLEELLEAMNGENCLAEILRQEPSR